LIEAGKPEQTPICIVENASRVGVRLKRSLREVAQHGLPKLEGPVTLLVGQALSLAQLQHKPLDDRAPEHMPVPPSQHAVA